MEIVNYLFTNFFKENMNYTILLLILALVSNILHTNVITYFNSALIISVQRNAFDKSVLSNDKFDKSARKNIHRHVADP